MRDFSIIKALVGESVTENELRFVDCYVHPKLGLFIPSVGTCQYAQRQGHTHPSYMITILFSVEESGVTPKISIERNHYLASVMSPDVPHTDFSDEFIHYYCILIDRDYFDSQYRLYTAEMPCFNDLQFALCSDILKTLNTFAFEYSKQMPNSDLTLEAQVTVITHWIIRSILGENLDLRMISSNYAVARAQHYMEQHFDKNITVEDLAGLNHMSSSSFNRIFKNELGVTPIKYLIEIRIEKAKKLLRRNDIPIIEIASRCGFGSSAHFASNFKRLAGVTPSEYRNTYRHGG